MAKRQFSIGYVFTGDGSGLEGTIKRLGEIMKSFTGGSLAGFLASTLKIGGALFTLEKYMRATEKRSDTLDAAIGAVEGAFQGFFRSVDPKNWDQLINNIIRTSKATRDLAIAKDELGDFEASESVQIGFLQRSLESARLAAAGTTDKAQKAQYIQEAINTQKSITAIEVGQIERRLKITEDFFKTRENWSKEEAAYNIDQIRKIAGNYEYFFGPNSVTIEAMKKSLSDLQAKANLGDRYISEAERTELRRTKLTLGSLEIFKNLQDSMKPDEFKEYIKTIGDFFATIAKGDEDLIRLTKTLTTAENSLDSFKKTTEWANDIDAKRYLSQSGTNPQLKTLGGMDQAVRELTSNLTIVQNALGTLEDGFESFFVNTGNGFKGMIDSIRNSIMMLLGQLAAKAALFALLQVLFPGGAAAAWALSGLRAAVGIPGFASGTNFAPGGLSLVGERGPELVNLPRGSQVMPMTGVGKSSERLVAKLSGTELLIMLQRASIERSVNT